MITTQDVLQEIADHGQVTYPEECCGFLLGRVTEEGNHVTRLHRVENRQGQQRRRRYLILPDDYRAADRVARAAGLDVVGIYHSHPDHPAHPSATDLAEATFPGYTYVIVSVLNARAEQVKAWTLAPDRSRFDCDTILISFNHRFDDIRSINKHV